MIISVILTTFQRTSLLVRAARSVINQILPENVALELLISDDDPKGSGLSVLPELQEEASQHVRLQYLKRGSGPGGVARSRNKALSVCSGDWVVFLDDDDFLLDGAVTELLRVSEEQNCDFCAGSYQRVSEDAEGNVIEMTMVTPNWSREALLVGNQFPMGSFLVRRRLLTVQFNTQLKTHEDWLFLIDNISEARVAITSRPVVRVNQSVDPSRSHRNESGGAAQRAADYARVYALHPSPALAAVRGLVLQRLGGTSLDLLIGGPAVPTQVQYQETSQGRFLICNPMETVQNTLLREGSFKPLTARIAETVVSLKPGTVIDIGANSGVFSVAAARALPGCEFLSIEPQRMVFMQLCANLLANKLTNVKPLHLAIGNSADGHTVKVPFFDIFDERYTGSVSLDSEVQVIRGAIEGIAEPSKWASLFDTVSLSSLDELSKGLTVAFVKVDVEGMELEVLSSGEVLLTTQRPALFFGAWALPQFEKRRLELLQYVFKLGYSVLQLGEDYLAYHPQALEGANVLAALAGLGIQLAVPAVH